MVSSKKNKNGASSSNWYYLTVVAENVNVQVGLNGLTLINPETVQWDSRFKGISTALPVNEWLMPGTNSLDVFIDWPRDVSYEAGKAKVKIMVFLVDPKEEVVFPSNPKSIETFATFEFPGSQFKEGFPFTRSVPFEFSQKTECKLWKEAEKIALKPSNERKTSDDFLLETDQQQIFLLLQSLQQAIVKKKTATAVELLSYKWTDVALSNSTRNQQKEEGVFKEQIEMIIKEKPTAQPLDPKTLLFRLGGKQNVVQVFSLTPDGKTQHPLRFEFKKALFKMPVCVAKIKENWKIVR